MAPKAPDAGSRGTPSFLARMRAIPALNDALIFATHIYDNTKESSEFMRAAFVAAEEGMRAAATGALPLATPIVDRVGGWEAVDDWACRGLDRVAEAAPIITKPTEEIVNTTRERMLKAVAGTKTVPTSLSAAFTARASNTVELMSTLPGSQMASGVADRVVTSAHSLVDQYLPAQPGDPKETVPTSGSVGMKTSALVMKARRRIHRTMHKVAYPQQKYTFHGKDAAFTLEFLSQFGRQSASMFYKDLTRQPMRGEQFGFPMRFARATFQMNLNIAERLVPNFQNNMANMRKSFNAGDVAGMAKEVADISRTSVTNAWTWSTEQFNAGRMWAEDSLRQAMASYEQRQRMETLSKQKVKRK